ncbi:MAG: excinuclease ABC subunit UvrC [Thermoplasmata archaeon]|nr:MAG: excinuclease ABC subunit UvrC [Thermoplasmata archaeon]
MARPPPEVRRTLGSLPDAPGVYIFRDADGEVIYVGKAISLRKRAPAHFKGKPDPWLPISEHVDEVASVEHFETRTEIEALFLEANLIKRHQPRHNVRLKDDKRYPLIKFTKEPFPRIAVVREEVEDGAEYFGPYTSALPTRTTVNLLQKNLGIRVCRRMNPRGCLYMHIGLCSAPCVGAISEEEYCQRVRKAKMLLRGDVKALRKDLEATMHALAAEQRFEEAAEVRDYLQGLDRMMELQSVHLTRERDDDYIAVAASGRMALVFVLQVRGGKVLDKRVLRLAHGDDVPRAEVLQAVIPQLYRVGGIPRTVAVPERLPDRATLELALTQAAGRKVHITVPCRGEPMRLMRLAEKNAASYAKTERLRTQLRIEDRGTEELGKALRLRSPPGRIEAFDISHHQGEETVASMVTFREGKPLKKDYRRFKIKKAAPGDDYAAMREVVMRRYGGTLKGTLPEPDLVLIDGGKGQLAAAGDALGMLSMRLPLAALAKEREELFVPGDPRPLDMEPDSDGVLLLRRIRDEAHRFAISYHRRRRRGALTRSRLLKVPGIGPQRAQALLRHFGSLRGIEAATREELEAAPGMGKGTAEALWNELHGEGTA